MTEVLEPEIAVVGASPAGLAATLAASRGGAETVLLESRPQIGVPEPPAKVGFHHLWGASFQPPARTVQARVESTVLHSPRGGRVTIEAPAWVLDRTALDRHLLNLAGEAGATVRTGLGALTAATPTRLEAQEAELTIAPAVTIFADGARSLAQRFLSPVQRPEALTWGIWDTLELDPGLSTRC